MFYAAEYALPGHQESCATQSKTLWSKKRRDGRSARSAGIEVAVHRASVSITGRIACPVVDGTYATAYLSQCMAGVMVVVPLNWD
jgi:hypothetical protein